ncbi:MAG: hypothetical protein ACRDSP_25520 [Pseudonocardiaceae bacterium]
MNDPQPLTAQVLVTTEVSPGQEQAIVDAFRALGVAAHIRVVPTRRGPDEMQWLMLATLPIQAMLSGVGAAVAENLGRSVKHLVGRVFRDRDAAKSCRQVLVLREADTGLQVVLEAGLPEEAYSALVALDLSAFEQGPVHYDLRRRRWRSELDEWRQRPPPR